MSQTEQENFDQPCTQCKAEKRMAFGPIGRKCHDKNYEDNFTVIGKRTEGDKTYTIVGCKRCNRHFKAGGIRGHLYHVHGINKHKD